MACELCGSEENVTTYTVAPKDETIMICSTCAASIEDPTQDEKHWNCLHDSMWSENPAVQVMAFRLFTKLGAQDQLDMMYLEEDVRSWAEAGLEEEETQVVRDSNGAVLSEGDTVTLIKDLPVKGAGFTAKQGTTVKNIRLAPSEECHIQGKINGTMIFIKTEFLKKV